MSEWIRVSPNGTRVRTIPATVQRFSPQRAAVSAKKRVVAYARVSTDEEEQLTSRAVALFHAELVARGVTIE